MWTCRNCGLSILPGSVKPEIDGDNFYFVCPGCDAQNELVNVGGNMDGEAAQLIQPDI